MTEFTAYAYLPEEDGLAGERVGSGGPLSSVWTHPLLTQPEIRVTVYRSKSFTT